MPAKKTRKRRPVVRGPQLALKIAGRTPRLRFIEPPRKVVGSPFVAFRVPRELHSAFVGWCRKRKRTMPDVFRAYMSKVTGVRVEAAGDGE